MPDHLIGLLLGAEEDWPRAFETVLGMVGPIEHGGEKHTLSSERLTIEPFRLDDRVRTPLVIDRLAHWYYHPREWLKKASLVNGTYLLNSPFTFQSMEKHSAYCALVRMGFHVPATTLVPYKNPVDNVRWAYTADRYNREFDLDKVAEDLGYPLYMKPFDGGAWRGVSRINDRGDLHRAYDESGEMLMHLQATVEYDHFARALSIGPETMVMDFRPEQPMHQRYAGHWKRCLCANERERTKPRGQPGRQNESWDHSSANIMLAPCSPNCSRRARNRLRYESRMKSFGDRPSAHVSARIARSPPSISMNVPIGVSSSAIVASSAANSSRNF